MVNDPTTFFNWLCGGTGIHRRLKISRPSGLRVRIPPEPPIYSKFLLKNRNFFLLTIQNNFAKRKVSEILLKIKPEILLKIKLAVIREGCIVVNSC